MKILINLICQNSAPELLALLETIKGRTDGLVAVDGGSHDDTVAILKKWGEETGIPVHVKTNPWPDDFAVQRNMCLNVTRAEYGIASPTDDIWVLMIDDDDTLVEFDRDQIEKLIAANTGICGLMTHMDNENGFFDVLQFFRLTADVSWRNPIHEFVKTEGPKGLPPTGTLTTKRGRSAKHEADPERNIRIGRRFVESSPLDPRGRFYLSRDLLECPAIPIVQRYAEAEGHLRFYLALNTGFPAQDRYARLLLAKLLCDSGRAAEARKMMIESLERDPDNRSAYEAIGRMTEGKLAGVWQRLAAAAEGSCILPYGSKLPEKSPATA